MSKFIYAHAGDSDWKVALGSCRGQVRHQMQDARKPTLGWCYLTDLGAPPWPLTMFLTPDGQPFWGGTYFPPFTRGGRPGFAEVLQTIAELWRDRANAIEQNVKQLGAGLASLSETTPAEPISSDLVEAIREQLEQRLDRVDGGFGAAPKFPQATNLDFLWRAWKRTGRDALRQGVLLTLDHISQGGVYDHLGSIELLDEETEAALARDRAVLFSLREGRVRPARDDKVLADWNGLTIAAIAKASCVFERLDWLDVAIEAFHFVRSAMTTNDGRLLHSWREGRARHSAVLDDYAAMCRAALALHEATGAPSYLEAAGAGSSKSSYIIVIETAAIFLPPTTPKR